MCPCFAHDDLRRSGGKVGTAGVTTTLFSHARPAGTARAHNRRIKSANTPASLPEEPPDAPVRPLAPAPRPSTHHSPSFLTHLLQPDPRHFQPLFRVWSMTRRRITEKERRRLEGHLLAAVGHDRSPQTILSARYPTNWRELAARFSDLASRERQLAR